MRSYRDLVREHSGWLLVLAGGLLLPLITDLGASWLERTFGQTPANLIRLVAVLGGLALVLWVLAILLRGKPEPVTLVPRDARPPRLPGLVALVGPGREGEKPNPLEQAAAKAIEYHLAHREGEEGLKVCWLIASSGEGGGVPMAEEIRRAYQGRCSVVVCPVGDAFAVQDTYDAVQRIYNREIYGEKFKELELMPERVIADFTGGTKPMSAGMVLACGRYRPMQYTTGRKEGIASMPRLVQFRPTRRRRGG